jgi:hypothetical protein
MLSTGQTTLIFVTGLLAAACDSPTVALGMVGGMVCILAVWVAVGGTGKEKVKR